MHYQEIQPIASLKQHISCYWKFSTTILPNNKVSLEHHVLPDGCVSVCYIIQENAEVFGPLLMGPRTEIFQTQIYPNSAVIGVRFMPGAFYFLYDLDLTSLRNQVLFEPELIPLFCDDKIITSLNLKFSDFGVFDEFLSPLFEHAKLKTPHQIHQAVQIILKNQGNVKVEELANQVHWGIRHFQRKFKSFTGLTPKEFIKNIRLRNAMIQVLLKEEGLQDALFDAGYYDQSHFNRDFSMVAGLNPTNFLKYIKQIEHKGINKK